MNRIRWFNIPKPVYALVSLMVASYVTTIALPTWWHRALAALTGFGVTAALTVVAYRQVAGAHRQTVDVKQAPRKSTPEVPDIEVVDALRALGYSRTEAQRMTPPLNYSLALEDRIRIALSAAV